MHRVLGLALVTLVTATSLSRAESVPLPTLTVTIPNGGFEGTEAAPWQIYGPTAIVTAADCLEGTQCLRLGIDGGSAELEQAGVYQDVTVQAVGGAARLSAGLVVDAALAGDTAVELKLEAGTVEVYGLDASFTAPASVGTWQTRSFCVDLPSSADGQPITVRPVVTVTSETGSGTGAVRIDDFQLEFTPQGQCVPTPTSKSDDGGCATGGAMGLLSGLVALGFLAMRRAA